MSENIVPKIEQVSLPVKPEIKTGQTLEHAPESIVEKSALEKKVEQEGSSKPEVKEGASSVTSTAPTITDDYHVRREAQIDAYLSDGLSETFLAMTPAKQKIFKEEGEVTAKKINVLLDATKINVGKIISLIKNWLKLITGINRFFLDQEAKIKADKIIKIKNKL